MITLTIDGRKVQVVEGTTIFQAAEQMGISIPHFCYHRAFEPEGTCRMCLVEIEGAPKLELSCSTVVREGMTVRTRSQKVVEARRGVLEFLLAEHPMDCPICDQAGDCKLQDYYEEYGLFDSRFAETKDRHKKLTPLGKNLIHDQERCVLCRRCVRFLREVTKTGEMGVFERGAGAEVNLYEDRRIDNNYSGNLAQLCPVGAITDSDFRFQTRSWFLEKGDSICPLCSNGCAITIEFHPGFSRFSLPKRVYRVRARSNPAVNGDWICDLGRYGYDVIDQNRMEKVLDRAKPGIASVADIPEWLEGRLTRMRHMNKTTRIAVVLNSGLSNEELFLARRIFQDDLGTEDVFLVDPPDGEADDLLLKPERTPNRRGAAEVGLKTQEWNPEALNGKCDLLIVFGNFLAGKQPASDIQSLLAGIKDSVLFAPHISALDGLFSLAVPTAVIAEKAGTLTNSEGRVQSFSPVLPPRGQAVAEWRILAELGRRLNIRFADYSRLKSAEDIFPMMSREIPFFGKKSE